MSSLRFEMRPVEEKRKKGSLKKSMYDPILDQFIESGHNLAEITVEGKKPHNALQALIQRIKARGLEIEASTAGDFIYLERKPSST